jgi:hypothetical protein
MSFVFPVLLEVQCNAKAGVVLEYVHVLIHADYEALLVYLNSFTMVYLLQENALL